MNQYDIEFALNRLKEAREYQMRSSHIRRLLAEGQSENKQDLLQNTVQILKSIMTAIRQPAMVYKSILKVIGLL
jgi:hypothetical protein